MGRTSKAQSAFLHCIIMTCVLSVFRLSPLEHLYRGPQIAPKTISWFKRHLKVREQFPTNFDLKIHLPHKGTKTWLCRKGFFKT